MTAPRVLIPHQVGEEIARDLREEIAARLPEAPLTLATTEAETAEHVADVEVVVTYGFGREWIERADALGWIQVLSAGVDSYDLEWLAGEEIALTNAAGVHAEPMAQQVLCYTFLFERGILGDLRRQARREWDRHWGEELGDKTIGIVGVGAIGSRVAERLQGFDATVLGTKRDPTEGGEAVDELYGPDGLPELLARADYLVVTCPLTDETRGSIDADALAALADDAVVINVARGGIVDEAALIDALEEGRLGGAALDVFAEEPLPEGSPLWGHDDVIITPHMAGTSQFLNRRKAELFARNYPNYLDSGALENRIV